MSWTNVLNELANVGLTQAKIDFFVANDPVVKGAVIMKTEQVRDRWLEIWDEGTSLNAPGRPAGHPYETGEYRDSIHCEYVTKPSGYFYGKVVTRDWKAHWLEYGSVNNPEFAPAQRTVDSFHGKRGEAHECGPNRANRGNWAGNVSA